MTNKLIAIAKSPMELDIDSFLDSHLTSDSDNDSNPVLHRTLDEILNDSDSSGSSSPSSVHEHRLLQSRDDAVSEKSIETVKPSEFDEKSAQGKSGLSNRVRLGEFSNDSFWRVSSSRPLPSLFGGVKSNAKPGAALAAAAAASRLVPTPHAAAIKSRRAGRESLQKVVVDGGESGSVLGEDSEIVSDGLGSSNGDSNGSSLEISRSDEKVTEDNEKISSSQSSVVDVNVKLPPDDGNLETGLGSGQFFSIKNDEIEEETVPEVIEDFTVRNGNENSSSTSTSPLNTNDEVQINTSSVDVGEDSSLIENPTTSAPNNVVNRNVLTTPESENDVKIDEDVALTELETKDLENGMHNSVVNEAGLVDDDTGLISDITELVEERIGQLESERISKKAEKKSRPSLKPLELAEELEKKQASTGLHLEEGAAAQPMRLEGVRRGSIALGFFDISANNAITRTVSSQAFKRDHGSPQVLAVHSNFVALGMSKGVIVLVPSKYSAYNVDNMDAKMVMLGLHADRSHAPVTSICFNQQGDLLLAGYGDGHVTVWDVQRASAAKVITGEHTSPVVHTLFLGQDFQTTRQFKAVTGDSKGLVLLHAFSVVPLLNRFSIKTQCLLDGQKTGIVLSASPLLFDELPGGTSLTSQGNATVSTSSIGSMMGGVVGGDAGWKLFNEGSSLVEEGVVIFVTHQTALVVKLTPTLEVYAQLSKPDGVREGSMPYTAWKCITQSNSSSENTASEATQRVSLLAVAWDRKVQVAKLVKSELKVYGKWTLEAAAIGVAWLDDQMLVVLMSTGQLCLFAKDGTMIHQTSFAMDGSRADDLVAYHTNFINVFGNPEKAYQNCVALRGASIYILGPTHLVVSRLLPWKERIQVLRKAGDWMGALNMAMTLYDGQAHGVIDLPRNLDAVQEEIMPYLVELLLSYVDEVFSYISVACCNQIGKKELDDSKSRSSSVQSEIKEQFTRVGGVAVEFCVHIKRSDILFDEIYSKFVAVQHKDTFLELLEPYILKDMLGSLPPEIMQALVEHYSSKGWLQRVEQCVLHMDISSLDFNQVVRLCREHGLYGALVYLFNKGLDDFRAPLEELLVVLRNSKKGSANAIGYRMLVYLKYSFSGLAFPPGHGSLPPTRLPSLREELLQFLLEDSEVVKSQADSRLLFRGTYLNLYHLLELDTEATLDVLRCALVKVENQKTDFPLHDSAIVDPEAKKEMDPMAESQNLLVQNTVNAIVHILNKENCQTNDSDGSDDIGSIEDWPSKKDIGHLFDFIAYYVACGQASVSKSVLNQILEYLTSETNLPPTVTIHSIETFKRREKQLLALLEVLPEIDWDASYVLQLCEKAQFFQVCGLIHAVRHHYITALDSYMKDQGDPVHAFSFINYTLLQLSDTECADFRSAVIHRIPELVELSREGAFFLVIDHFNKEGSFILSELRSHPKSLFLYLKTIIEAHLSGMIDFSFLTKNYTLDVSYGRRGTDHSKGLEAYLKRISDFPKFLRNSPVDVTDEMIELYLELLCQYERDSVLKFLQIFDSYRVEHCLRLCQDYGIIDAAAFLLERVGNIGSALLLALSSLNEKFIELDTAVGSLVSDAASIGSTSGEIPSAVLKTKELNAIRGILHACIGLCQRNTPGLNPEESETLWFKLLDSFCEPLLDSYNGKMVNEEASHVGVLNSLGSEEGEDSCIIKWRISESRGGAHIFRKLFSEFIKEIVEGMIGYVRLPTIMSKLLSDNGSQEFGDFKLTILGMLGTYGFERRILDTAKSLIEDDTFYTMSLLKKGASHGYAPRSLTCCICNCLLTKNASGSSLRLFNCGHATHLHCEFLENDAPSRGSSSGCPVCMPKKTSQRHKTKSVLAENGLVNKNSSRPQQTQGIIVLHPNETDALENFYATHQISRFEILNNLQKDQRATHIEHLPQLRLAPPAVYHEKVKKGTDFLMGESSSGGAKLEKPSKNRKLRDLKARGSSLRFPLKSNIFGKEKIGKR